MTVSRLSLAGMHDDIRPSLTSCLGRFLASESIARQRLTASVTIFGHSGALFCEGPLHFTPSSHNESLCEGPYSLQVVIKERSHFGYISVFFFVQKKTRPLLVLEVNYNRAPALQDLRIEEI